MSKKNNLDGQRPEPEPYQFEHIDDHEREENRTRAQEQIAKIRAKCEITSNANQREIEHATRNDSPNISSITLPSRPQEQTTCRCGVPTVRPDWSMNGITNPPLVCPKCTELPSTCYC